jgi:methyl-accepting chemotaxis protein
MTKYIRVTGLSMKYKIILPVVIMLILSSFVAGLIVYYSISNADEERVMEDLNALHSMISDRLKEAETAAGMLTDNLAGNNDVQFSVALQDTGLIEQNTASIVKSIVSGSFLRGYFDFIDAQGTVIYSSSEKWLKGKSLAESRSLVKQVIDSRKKITGIEPGPDGLYVRAISPINYNGDFVGAVEFNVSLESIFSKALGHAGNIDVALLLPEDAVTGMHSSTGFLKTGEMFLAYSTRPEIFRMVGSNLMAAKTSQVLEAGDVIFKTFPFELSSSRFAVKCILACDSSTRGDAVRAAMKKLGFALGASTLFIALAMIFFLSRIIAPLQDIVEGMSALANGRFTNVVPKVSSDEFGELARLSNNILFSFGRLVMTLHDDADNLVSAAGYIKQSGREFQEGIVSLDRESDILATKAATVSESLQQTSRSMDDLSMASSEIASSVGVSAASVAEVLEMSMHANSVINSLGESSRKIGEIIEVINDIAEQTNLLALNATIEAARAGEAGKGFAVVAGEVKELAKQTGLATGEIAAMVNAIQTDTQKAVEAVEEIGDKISSVTDMTNTIASATEEQTATIAEISGTLETGMHDVVSLAEMAGVLKEATDRFSENVASSATSQEVIVELANELQTLTRFFDVSQDAVDAAAADADDKVRLLSVTLKHFRWKQAVILAILEGRPVAIENDPGKCDLGRFLHEKVASGDHGVDMLEQVMDKHKKLHGLGQSIMQHLEAGKQTEARSIFRDELLVMFDDMMKSLENMMKKQTEN